MNGYCLVAYDPKTEQIADRVDLEYAPVVYTYKSYELQYNTKPVGYTQQGYPIYQNEQGYWVLTPIRIQDLHALAQRYPQGDVPARVAGRVRIIDDVLGLEDQPNSVVARVRDFAARCGADFLWATCEIILRQRDNDILG